MASFQQNINRFKFILIRVISPKILNLFYRLFPRRKKTLLIIKNDGIGDYILFRNYLACIKSSKRFSDHKIYLLGNQNFKSLAEQFDATVLDGFYWYSDSYFLKWKMVKLLFALQKLRVESIAYVNYSRSTGTDWLIKNIVAKNKYGFDGDQINQTIDQKHQGNTFYTTLFKPAQNNPHEFYRNADLIEQLTGENCSLQRPTIDTNLVSIKATNQICIFMGGSAPNKRWPTENIIALCKELLSNRAIQIVLTGGFDTVNEAADIIQGLASNHIINKVGKTSLVDLCRIIGSSRMLLSNDSAALHIAAALNTPAVVTAKGDLYGRFIPYPPEITANVYSLFPPNYQTAEGNYNKWSNRLITEIAVADVFNVVDHILKSQETTINNSAAPQS